MYFSEYNIIIVLYNNRQISGIFPQIFENYTTHFYVIYESKEEKKNHKKN